MRMTPSTATGSRCPLTQSRRAVVLTGTRCRNWNRQARGRGLACLRVLGGRGQDLFGQINPRAPASLRGRLMQLTEEGAERALAFLQVATKLFQPTHRPRQQPPDSFHGLQRLGELASPRL